MAAIVQVDTRAKYVRTTNLKKMMTHPLLDRAIREDWENIRSFLPARTATGIRYERGAKTAKVWNEGGSETNIDLPLENGWYVPDGNPFAIPNGKPSNRDDPVALYLIRHQDRGFSGPLGRGYGWFDYDDGRRGVVAGDGWSKASGVALINGRGAPLGDVDSLIILRQSDGELIVRGSKEQIAAAARLIGQLKV